MNDRESHIIQLTRIYNRTFIGERNLSRAIKSNFDRYVVITVTGSSDLLKLIISDSFWTSIPFDGRNSILSAAIDTIDID